MIKGIFRVDNTYCKSYWKTVQSLPRKLSFSWIRGDSHQIRRRTDAICGAPPFSFSRVWSAQLSVAVGIEADARKRHTGPRLHRCPGTAVKKWCRAEAYSLEPKLFLQRTGLHLPATNACTRERARRSRGACVVSGFSD